MSDTKRFPLCEAAGLGESSRSIRNPNYFIAASDVEAYLERVQASNPRPGIDKPISPHPAPPWEFKPEDFNAFHYASPQANATGVMASIANQKLQEWLAQAPVVYCRRLSDNSDWHYFDNEAAPLDTHAGRLVCIEPLKAADTAESLLREVADTLKLGQGLDNGEFKRINGLIDRARKLLKEGE